MNRPEDPSVTRRDPWPIGTKIQLAIGAALIALFFIAPHGGALYELSTHPCDDDGGSFGDDDCGPVCTALDGCDPGPTPGPGPVPSPPTTQGRASDLATGPSAAEETGGERVGPRLTGLPTPEEFEEQQAASTTTEDIAVGGPGANRDANALLDNADDSLLERIALAAGAGIVVAALAAAGWLLLRQPRP